MKPIPNSESTITTLKIHKIFEHEKKHRNIDWHAFYAGDKSENQKITELLSNLNLEGDADTLRTDPMKLTSLNQDKIHANLHFTNSPDAKVTIDQIQSLRGNGIKEYILSITQALQLAEQQVNATQIAAEIGTTGILAIGGTWAVASVGSLAAGSTLTAACAAGVAAFGIGSAISAITIIIVLALIPFLILMDKKAEMLALILNRTPHNIQMNYYFAHGKLVVKPHELIPKEKRYTSISKRIKISNIEICSAGIMFVSKYDKALIGVEGACHLTLEGGSYRYPNGVYLGFSVPLIIGDNRCFMSWEKYNSLEEFFNAGLDRTNDNGSIRHIQANVDSPDGGEVAMIAVVEYATPILG